MSRRFRRAALALPLCLLLCLPGQAAPQVVHTTLPVVADADFVFDRAIPPSAPVRDEWFSDAVFLGDARAKAFLDAGLFTPGLSLAQVGLDVTSARSGAVFLSGGERLTLAQALEGGDYGKVYLMLGFNEATWMSEDSFYREYAALIDQLRQLLPDAQLYLQTILPVTAYRSSTQNPDNDLLARRSELLRKLAREKRVYLLDAHAALAPDGALPSELSQDGLYLSPAGNQKWLEFLKTHTMGT